MPWWSGWDPLPAPARHIRNDYGIYAWGGVCPPPGDKPHRYVFTVYAVDTENLGPDADASPAAGADVSAARTHAVACASPR